MPIVKEYRLSNSSVKNEEGIACVCVCEWVGFLAFCGG